MGPTHFLLGTLYLTTILAAFGVAAVGARRWLTPSWGGAPARLVEVVIGTSMLVVSAQLLGMVGAFTRLGLILAALAIAVSGWQLARRAGRCRVEAPAPLSPGVPSWAVPLALAVAAAAVLHWSGGVQESLNHGIYKQDSTWYHLPVAAGFFQTGNTWSLQFTDPMALAAWFYPMSSELLHAVGMLAFGNDFASPFLNIVWMVLSLLAAWCLGRPLGLGASVLVSVAIVLDSNMMQVQAGNAPSDIAGVFFVLAAAAILLNADAVARARGSAIAGGPLLLGALAAGLAIGTKITLLAPVAVLTVGVLYVTRPHLRVRASTFWLGGIAATGGYWYLRNLMHAGNPLPWVSLGPLPGTDQAGLYPRPPHSVADYATDYRVWAHQFAPMLGRTIGHLWPLILLGAAAGLFLALRRGPGMQRALALAGIAAAVAYVFVPVSASGSPGHPTGFETNLRYLIPALALGLALMVLQLGAPQGRRARLAIALTAVFAVDVVTSPTWKAGQILAGLALVAILIALPWGFAWMRRAEAPVPSIAVVGAVCLMPLLALVYVMQRDYLRHRYLPSLAPPVDNPGFRATPDWRLLQAWARQLHDARIGIVGPPAAFGQYVFDGSDLSNRVSYLGQPGPHGTYRPIGDCAAWRRRINEERVRYVVVTPASAIGPGSLPQESLWMSRTAAAHEILRAGPAAVYRVDGELSPKGCASEGLPPVLRVPGGGFAIPSAGPEPPPQPPRTKP
jgi:hypothetical protein